MLRTLASTSEMTYCIFDTGNLLASFEREQPALAALEQLAANAAPEDRDRLLLVVFDDDGRPIADCAPGERIALPA